MPQVVYGRIRIGSQVVSSGIQYRCAGMITGSKGKKPSAKDRRKQMSDKLILLEYIHTIRLLTRMGSIVKKGSCIFFISSLLHLLFVSAAFSQLPSLDEKQKAQINLEARKVQKADGSPRWDNPDYPYYWKANGCGPNKWFSILIPDGPYPKSKLWVDVCNIHDRDYMTLTSSNSVETRKAADQKLFTGMTFACGGDKTCKTVATAFYVPISKWPQSNFEESQNEQRDYETWAAKYLNDNDLISH